MPTVLQINTVANIGSTGRIAEKIGNLAIDEGWSSYIAYGRNARESKSHLIRIGGMTDIYAHVLGSKILDGHGLFSRRATKNLIKEIETIHPDVIHLHNIHGYYLNYPLLFEYLASKNIPVVWTLHDCWAYTGHCVYYSSVKCERWKTGCFDCPKKRSYPDSIIDCSKSNYQLKKKCFGLVNNLTIVPVSCWLGSEVKESFLRKNTIHVIQNGINLNVFYPRDNVKCNIREKYGIDDRFMILSVATKWHQDNGFYDFLELRKKLDTKYLIVLVGVSEHQKEILPEGIIGIPRTENMDELAELYTTADIAITTQIEATFGLVTVEAMACGTPVIVYNSTACPEVVTKQTGFVIPPKNIDAMKNCIMDYATNKRKIDFSDYCIKQASLYNEDNKYKEYIDLYKSLL